MAKISRNDPCHCGSGKKYKLCHLGQEDDSVDEVAKPSRTVPAVLSVLVLVGSVGAGIVTDSASSGVVVLLAGAMFVGAYVVLRKPPPGNPNSGNPSGLNFGR